MNCWRRALSQGVRGSCRELSVASRGAGNSIFELREYSDFLVSCSDEAPTQTGARQKCAWYEKCEESRSIQN